jgi:nucleoside-diphosphate-sugar epimerase
LKNKKKLLIAGGTGFIGYHLAKKAVKKGYIVTSLSSKRPKPYRYIKAVKYIICNTLNIKLLKKKLNQEFDIVVNLSGYVNHQEKKKTYLTHYQGCKNLANIFLKKKINSFIQIGSGMENGNAQSPQKERGICKPLTNYAFAKYKASLYLLKLFKQKGFPVIILRLYQAYGPKQDFNRLIPTTIKKSLLNKEIPTTLGNQVRDFIFIDDLTEIILKFSNTRFLNKRIFNIGSTKPYKIKDVIKKIVKIIGKGKPNFGKIKLRKGEIMNMYPNTSNMIAKLKWRPKTSLTKGLKLTIKSYKNEYKK